MAAAIKETSSKTRRNRKQASVPRPPDKVDTSTYRGQFGANLRSLREKRFHTQEDFVSALNAHGVPATTATVSRWEKGLRVPDLNDWPGIAATLKVSVRSLLPAAGSE